MKKLNFRHGDTVIEVMFAFALFAMVSMIAMKLMNDGLSRAQVALETTMTRNEIDAQAETLRFIHGSVLSERELGLRDRKYIELWKAIESKAIDKAPPLNYGSCSEAEPYRGGGPDRVFLLNTRKLHSNAGGVTVGDENIIGKKKMSPASLYPRIIYRKGGGSDNSAGKITEGQNKTDISRDFYDTISKAEGIWMIIAKEERSANAAAESETKNTVPEFYDVHIRSCWYGPGEKTPRTIGTTMRLYNPSFIEERKDV